ncbi:MAG: hypothetical protein AAF918_20375 [Pseudomonadota bacterium]
MSEPVAQPFMMVQDNSCHWYLIPAEYLEAWDDFLDIPEDDERSWNVPDWAREIDGPHLTVFYYPREIGATTQEGGE